jgi:hypothetical protein
MISNCADPLSQISESVASIALVLLWDIWAAWIKHWVLRVSVSLLGSFVITQDPAMSIGTVPIGPQDCA